jgi:nicotinate phosphoribosyltransferase
LNESARKAGLLTDFYQFVMAQAYFDQKRHEQVGVFHLFFRRHPFLGNWTIAGGISDALDYVENFSFGPEAIDYLASLSAGNKPLFSKEFLAYLKTVKPHVDILGVPEGEIVFPYEPILRVSGPLFLCQLLETPLLNLINFQTLIATKAKRLVTAAQGKPIIDFGLRRAQGFDGGISATRAAFVGGVSATSNVWAAKQFNIPPSGTLGHSFIMSYEKEEDAFLDFCRSFSENAVLLVDTYEPLRGIDNAIKTFLKIKSQGHKPFALRIDSGDIAHLSKVARACLDAAALSDVRIIASGDLDEEEIERLLALGAPVDIFGVGTRLVTGHKDPALTGVYKLSSIFQNNQWRDTYKKGAEKSSLPGHQCLTRLICSGSMVGDLVYDQRRGITSPQFLETSPINLHVPLMKDGVILYNETIAWAQNRVRQTFSLLPVALQSIHRTNELYPVNFDKAIAHRQTSSQNLNEDNREGAFAY